MFQTRFEYGPGPTVWEPRLPPRPWIPAHATVGGSRTAAAGVPASYTVRVDSLVTLTLRLDEDEWPDLVNLILWGQLGEAFTWFADAADPLSGYDVYLDDPQAGAKVAPERTEMIRILECSITLRGVTAPPWPNYFP